MSDTRREQRPLLCESASDEELRPRGTRQSPRPKVNQNGRARYKLKGAAAIFAQWPNHWSTLALYLWIGMGVMSLVFFIIYNNLIVISSYITPLRFMPSKTPNDVASNSINENSSPQVYMHIFTGNEDENDLNKYTPYINSITESYLDFKFNLFIIMNDSSATVNVAKGENDNLYYLNSLLSANNKIRQKTTLNIKNAKVQHILLSNYMDESPLGKQWRHFPKRFIPFLVRAVSIWDKGGIAFNPQILTPDSPNTQYIDKLHNLMKRYRKTVSDSDNLMQVNDKSAIKNMKSKNKVNNIRDIIEALERDEDVFKASQENLTEAESKPTALNRKLLSNKLFSPDENYKLTGNRESDKHEPHVSIEMHNGTRTTGPSIDIIISGNTKRQITDSGKYNESNPITPFEPKETTTTNLLTGLFDFLLRDRNGKEKISHGIANNNPLKRTRKNAISNNVPDDPTRNLFNNNNLYQTAKSKYSRKYSESGPNVYDNKDKLILDLKGNIIATETPCHAFIGTIFSNAIHGTSEETIMNYIIAELSIFCKGILSSCNGIDIILL